MEEVPWQVLVGTRGGPNRARILRALDERPRNAHQIAGELDLGYETVRHHLRVFEEGGRGSGDDYGTVYLPTDRARRHWDAVEEFIRRADP